ncbi:hypothetical protein GCM10007425_19170 [Lysinibacillus alkalisoli]|uniref:Uncharacterized protein n=1 Tax=Lysinibacillus alkalisoli TaxID=1911548 RepID=A0A917G6U3_9BACI|nr:hypothetical protein GCM10007425_19170 [Lysinibacillus alkalisoli]
MLYLPFIIVIIYTCYALFRKNAMVKKERHTKKHFLINRLLILLKSNPIHTSSTSK